MTDARSIPALIDHTNLRQDAGAADIRRSDLCTFLFM